MENREEVKVLGTWSSLFVLRVRIALNVKQVKYEFLEEVAGLHSKSELLLKSNPVYKKVPVLIHGSNAVCESLVILRYIDEAFVDDDRLSLLPSDPYDRALACFWACYIDDKWFSSLIGVIREQNKEAREESMKQVQTGLQLLEEVFSKCTNGNGKPFFNGESIGYLDIVFGSFMLLLKVAEKIKNVKFLDENKTPKLVTWHQCFCLNDAVKNVMPQFDKFFEYVKMRVGGGGVSFSSTN
ncbi:Glutathione transferase protein [Dioscorea alata]|uniref:Glutathione transferase protein n=1 Tax=Dioscorea alata TaxID=55571 RepID=A0ACB7UN55_DIOAL|nr:Glutathione transferase protein [Dioscorea alata]